MLRWYVRWQMGMQAMSLVNFLLLSISASPVIAKYLGCRSMWVFLTMPMIGVATILAIGYTMDRLQFAQRLDAHNRQRSTTWAEAFALLKRIDANLSKN